MGLERSRGGAPGRRAWAAAAAALAVALGACLAACGGSKQAASTEANTTAAATAAASTSGATTTAPAPTRTVRVYVVRNGKLAAEGREVPDTPGVGRAALQALLGDRPFGLTIANGVATLTGADGLTADEQAEVVATLTQFPTVTVVVIGGKRLTRLDIEAATPQILVESPLPGARVASPLRVTGTANTFEATLTIEILDRDGNTLSKKVVTATSGSGTRGTFATEIGFDTADAQAGTLYAYEASAEDGHPIHEVRVALTLLP